MYFLTRFELDFKKRSTMKALVSPNLFHGAVESSFPGERKRCLWRIDSLAGRNYLLLLSSEKPNLEHAVKQFGVDNAEQLWETTMDPKNRVLKRVTIDDAMEADNVFNMLMGEDVEPRREFITKNATYAKLDY